MLRRLFAHAPTLKLAYEFQEQLTAIFDQPLSKLQAKLKIQAWIKRVKQSGLSCFDNFLKTLDHWWEEITNFFIQRANSGFVEGFNNKIKVLKRRCYGLFNMNHISQHVFLDLHRFALFARQPPYLA